MGIIRFGANGWHARVGAGFDERNVVRIASALGATWQSCPEGSVVLVGYDTRRDSERLACVAGEVIAACGLRVAVAQEACPTPALAWAAAQDPACVGCVMLTASGRSCEYGGMLVRRADGGPLDEETADAIERRISAEAPEGRGPVERRDLLTPYIDALLRRFDMAVIAAWGPRVVVDPLYGTGVGVVAEALRRIGCEVTAIHDEVARDFRGMHPEPVEPWVDACERAVEEARADLGIVLDGDCDRVGFVDERGRLVTPHMVAPLVLEQQLREPATGGRVVATSATSVRLSRQADRLGCAFTMVPLGFESVYRELGEGDVLLGVDERGDVCLPAHLRERDGIACALALVELAARRRQGVGELVRACEEQVGHMEYGSRDIRLDSASMQRLRNLLPGMNPPLVAGEEPVAVSHAGGLRVTLADGSWLLLAPDAARSLCRARAEAPNASALTQLLSEASLLVDTAG